MDESDKFEAEVREHFADPMLDVRGEDADYSGVLADIKRLPLEERHRVIKVYLAAWEKVLTCPPGTSRLDHTLQIFTDKYMLQSDEEVPFSPRGIRENPKTARDKLKARQDDISGQLTRLWKLCEECGVGRPRAQGAHDAPPPATDHQREVAGMFSTLAELLNQVAEALRVELNCRVLENATLRTNYEEDFRFKNIMMVSALLDDPTDEFQALLLHLMKEADRENLRRFGDGVYKQKCISKVMEIEEGDRVVRRRVLIETHAWERHMDIGEFVQVACSWEHHHEMWQRLYSSKSGSYAGRLTEYLTETSDSLFPRLERDKMRNKYSFEDGVYDGNMDEFYPYNRALGKCPPPDMATCKFIPRQFMFSEGLYDWWTTGYPEDKSAWYDDIKTPALQKIFDAQKLGGDEAACETEDEKASIREKHRDVCSWLYAFLGRLLYPLNTLDKWQVVLFVKGHAGTGKSTLGQMVKMWFDPADIGILSNNAQTQFALWDLYEKLVYICFEVKNNFRMDQAELQSIISGEDVCIYRKHQNAVTQTWTVPGLFLGNESGDWFNTSNSISRRMVLARFDYKPSEPNPNLLEELREELPAILFKCNRAYRDKVAQHGSRDIWKVLPDYFSATQRHMQETTNPFTCFLKAQVNLDKGEDLFMPLNDLAQMFREYCDTNGHPRHKTQWNEDMYMTAFREQTPPLTVRTGRQTYNGNTYQGEWVFGITARTATPPDMEVHEE